MLESKKKQPQGIMPDSSHLPKEGKDWHRLTYRVQMPPYWPNTGYFPSEADMSNIANTLEAHEPRHVACVLLRLALQGGASDMSPDERNVIEDLIGMFVYMDGVPTGFVPEKK